VLAALRELIITARRKVGVTRAEGKPYGSRDRLHVTKIIGEETEGK